MSDAILQEVRVRHGQTVVAAVHDKSGKFHGAQGVHDDAAAQVAAVSERTAPTGSEKSCDLLVNSDGTFLFP